MKRSVGSNVTLAVWALLMSASGLQADVPSVVAVQGELDKVSAGVATNVVGSSQEMTLGIYSSTNASAALFGRSKVPVLLEQGRFVAEIGNSAVLTNVLSSTYTNLVDLLSDATNKTFYLGLQQTGYSSALYPLMRLQSVPFALVAGDVKQATRTFEVRNGTATLGKMVVQGETTLSGPVTFDATSAPVFSQPVTFNGDVKVASGTTGLAALTVDSASAVSNATLRGVSVGGATTVKGALTVASGMTNVTGAVTISAGKALNVSGSQTVSGLLSASSFAATGVNITGVFTPPISLRIKQIFGVRTTINTAVLTPPSTDSGWSNTFYQATATGSGTGLSRGYWMAPQNCFVTASYVTGRYGTGEEPVKPIALMSSGSTDYATIVNAANCIVLNYSRLDLGSTYAAYKDTFTVFMKKGEYLCWYSDYDNEETVFGSGFMRELSVLYFAN